MPLVTDDAAVGDRDRGAQGEQAAELTSKMRNSSSDARRYRRADQLHRRGDDRQPGAQAAVGTGQAVGTATCQDESVRAAGGVGEVHRRDETTARHRDGDGLRRGGDDGHGPHQHCGAEHRANGRAVLLHDTFCPET